MLFTLSLDSVTDVTPKTNHPEGESNNPVDKLLKSMYLSQGTDVSNDSPRKL